MSKFKLIALDLDGTLLDKMSCLPKENIKAISKAQKLGVKIALCTGRNPCEAKIFSSQLETPADWLVTSNGAYICDSNGSNVVFSEPLSNSDCQLLLNICKEFRTDPCFYNKDHLFYGDAFKKAFSEMNKKRNIDPNKKRDNSTYISSDEDWKKLLENAKIPFIKAIIYHENPECVDNIMEKLNTTNKFELAPSVLFGGLMKNVEINKKGIHKGSGLEKLCNHIGISMSDVMAFGDSDNDITMLKMSGLGIAMGNAENNIKNIADECTLSNVEFGVAVAIEKYIL